jgi:hypothetical protein
MLSAVHPVKPSGTTAMTIPASRVKSLCTDSEAALVRASRKGELEQLSHAQVKQLAVRARKLTNKWRDLKRSQSRTRSRQVGFGDVDSNTKLKKQIFREALTSFEARLVKLETSGTHAAEKSRPTTKKARSAEHRATRAAIRKGMTAVQDLVNSQVKEEEKPAAAPPAKPALPAKAVPALRQPTKVALPKQPRKEIAIVDQAKQRQAITAAKHSRVARSGKTTRLLSHVKSRGKRVQARRDARN